MLFRRLFLCALLVGACSGLLHAALQRWQVLPLIEAAEMHEAAAEARGSAAPEAHVHAHDHEADEWQPADGAERTVWTIIANVLAATGHALLLIPMIALWDRSRGGTASSWRTGLAWGACAWAATFLLPALGLPPELPGTGAAALRSRQAWWLLDVACSSTGLALLLLPRRHAAAWRCLGVALLVAPFVAGAPRAEVDGLTAVGGEAAAQMRLMSAQFLRATALATGLYWLSLGALSGAVVARWVRPLLDGFGGARTRDLLAAGHAS